MTHNYWITELLDNAMSLILLLSPPIAVFEEYVYYGKYFPLAWAKQGACQVAVLTAHCYS